MPATGALPSPGACLTIDGRPTVPHSNNSGHSCAGMIKVDMPSRGACSRPARAFNCAENTGLREPRLNGVPSAEDLGSRLRRPSRATGSMGPARDEHSTFCPPLLPGSGARELPVPPWPRARDAATPEPTGHLPCRPRRFMCVGSLREWPDSVSASPGLFQSSAIRGIDLEPTACPALRAERSPRRDIAERYFKFRGSFARSPHERGDRGRCLPERYPLP